uniref:Uncharacterized protein n=1 Tax=Caenorhabditis japonica TaxID=281687 RepID=A0A8R1EGY2_CAEJA
MKIETFLKTSRTNPRLTAPAIILEVFLNSISPSSVSTVKRRPDADGILGKCLLKKPLISEKNRSARVQGSSIVGFLDMAAPVERIPANPFGVLQTDCDNNSGCYVD